MFTNKVSILIFSLPILFLLGCENPEKETLYDLPAIENKEISDDQLKEQECWH